MVDPTLCPERCTLNAATKQSDDGAKRTSSDLLVLQLNTLLHQTPAAKANPKSANSNLVTKVLANGQHPRPKAPSGYDVTPTAHAAAPTMPAYL